jgi:hypothetical protein
MLQILFISPVTTDSKEESSLNNTANTSALKHSTKIWAAANFKFLLRTVERSARVAAPLCRRQRSERILHFI